MPTSSPILPRKIHFIWVGGPLPEAYYRNLIEISDIARQSGFRVHLWTDNPKHIYKAIDRLGIERSVGLGSIKVRDTATIIDALSSALSSSEYRLLTQVLDSESEGLSNLGAVSDLLRYAILYKEGGYYFDTDVNLVVKSFEQRFKDYIPNFAELPILFPGRLHEGANRYVGGNDILAAPANETVFLQLLRDALSNYHLMITQTYRQPVGGAIYDAKRKPAKTKGASLRKLYTIDASGPGALGSTLYQYAKNRGLFEKANGCIAPIDEAAMCRYKKVMGVTLYSGSDHSWIIPAKDYGFFTTERIQDNGRAIVKKRNTL